MTPTLKPRILMFDIESSGLKGDFANCFCVGYMYHGEKKASVVSIFDVAKACPSCKRFDTAQDALLMAPVHKIMSEADIWCGWYSKGFDWKFLNARFIEAGLPPLPDVPHIDLYYTAKHNFAFTSNRLASVREFLGTKTHKTALTKRIWRRAQAGHADALQYIVDHCRADVLVLDQVYEKLKPYIRQHPRVTGTKEGCRVCGGAQRSLGLRVTTTMGPRRRFICLKCGASETRSQLT